MQTGLPTKEHRFINNSVESGRVGSIPYLFQQREHTANISTSVKLRLLNTWCS